MKSLVFKFIFSLVFAVPAYLVVGWISGLEDREPVSFGVGWCIGFIIYESAKYYTRNS